MTVTRELHVLPFPDLAALLRGAPWRRVVALGDSIAEGVREPHPGYVDLSWIDRIAGPLRTVVRGLAVTNLGLRDVRAAEVRERQLPAALDFRPDLAVVAAGGNDALRRSFVPDDVGRELNGIVGPLRGAGADVLMIELLDIVASGLVPAEHAGPLDERMRALAEVTRAVADRHGAMLVEMRHHPASADPDVYASDRLHLNARGHAIVATEAIKVMGARIPITIELSQEEILEDLFWPHPPPGQWRLERHPGGAGRGATARSAGRTARPAAGRPRRGAAADRTRGSAVAARTGRSGS
jgi:lysophospholipase L1-like esterase